MMIIKLFIVLFIFYVVQMGMAYLQMEHFKKTILALRDKGIMGIGVKKGKIGKGHVVLLVSNGAGEIIEAKTMSGFSVLARFKEKKEAHGLHITKLLEMNNEKSREQVATKQALLQIQEKLFA